MISHIEQGYSERHDILRNSIKYVITHKAADYNWLNPNRKVYLSPSDTSLLGPGREEATGVDAKRGLFCAVLSSARETSKLQYEDKNIYIHIYILNEKNIFNEIYLIKKKYISQKLQWDYCWKFHSTAWM